MNKGSFGVRSRMVNPQDRRDLERAALAVVSALGYEDASILEAAGVLEQHARDLRRYRQGGNPKAVSFAGQTERGSDNTPTLQMSQPEDSVPEEKLTAEDLRGFLDFLGLGGSLRRPEELRRVQWGGRLSRCGGWLFRRGWIASIAR